MKCSKNNTPISIDLDKMQQNGYVAAFKIGVKKRPTLVVDSVERIYPPDPNASVRKTVEPHENQSE